MKTVKTLFMLLIAASPVTAFAWGMQGHRVVGGLAEHYLSASSKLAIKKLLGNESLAMASNWGDFIKSDHAYDYLSTWHYINLPSGMDQKTFNQYLQNDTSTDLYTRINFVVKQLRNKTLSREKQVFYLKLLIHFVGDAHQPMHTARPEDRGGNDIKLYWFGTPTNLHRLWDEQLVEYQQLSYTEYVAAINFATAAQVKLWQQQPLRQWLFESYQTAGRLYTEVKSEDKLTYPYNYMHVEILNSSLLKAGIRLAGILNAIYSA